VTGMPREAALALAAFGDSTRQLAREMLGERFEVVEAWGPVQMAVAHLELARDGQHVEWHTERGFADAVRVRDAATPALEVALAVATIAWARSTDARGMPRGPEVEVPRGVADADAVVRSNWRAVLDWLPTADHPRIERIADAWWQDWPFLHLRPGTDVEVADWVARVEDAARD